MAEITTKTSIIQSAIVKASAKGIIIPETLAEIEREYDEQKASLLRRKPWPFAFKIGRKFTETLDGEDLGYEYVYRILDSDGAILSPLQVLAVNPSSGSNVLSNLTPQQGLTIGLRISPVQGIDVADTLPSEYFYKNGILYSNQEVMEIIYLDEDVERSFTPDFTLALTYKLASFIVDSMVEGVSDGKRERFKKEFRRHLRIASMELRRRARSLDDVIIENWWNVFYRGGYLG